MCACTYDQRARESAAGSMHAQLAAQVIVYDNQVNKKGDLAAII